MCTDRAAPAANATSGRTCTCSAADMVYAESTGCTYAFGLQGGWTVRTDAFVQGARHINPINTDKDGGIVAARVASALGGLGQAATSDCRRDWLNPTRMSDASYTSEAADYIVNGLYGRVGQAGSNPLLGKGTLVLTSVHRSVSHG